MIIPRRGRSRQPALWQPTEEQAHGLGRWALTALAVACPEQVVLRHRAAREKREKS